MKSTITIFLVLFLFAFNGFSQVRSTDKGVGPFTNVKLAPIDKEKAKKGKVLFDNHCVACHNLDQTIVGPPLRNITKLEQPEFILNMMSNPEQMQKTNPRVKALMKKYNNIPMTDLKLPKQDYLNILEYLRSVEK